MRLLSNLTDAASIAAMEPVLSEQGFFTARSQGAGKALRTRARLLDAAVALFARDGFEGAAAYDIAREAGVANGTFYTYFRDRDDIAGVLAAEMAGVLAAELAQSMEGIDDARLRVARATAGFITFAAERPEWGRALFRAVWQHPQLHESVLSFIRADLELGTAQGHFTSGADPVVAGMIAAMTLGALYSRLAGMGPEVALRTGELQLRMLGVPPQESTRIAAAAIAPANFP